MPPSLFRATIARLGWTLRGLAAMLECDDRLVRRWASGETDIPPQIATWLFALDRAHQENPIPTDWRQRHTRHFGEETHSVGVDMRTGGIEKP